MKKILFLMAMMATMVLSANAQEVQQEPAAPQKHNVPAYRGMIEREQPNGDKVQTYLRGDEHKHWLMTVDGWQIRENKKGWLVYVKQNRKGEVVLTCRKAHNEDKRSKCEKRWLEKHGIKLNLR